MTPQPARLLLGTVEVVRCEPVTVRAVDGRWDDLLIELSDGTWALAKTTELWPEATT